MRVIPVVDLQGGLVVRGVAGRRHEYRPVESVLCDGATPRAVGAAFVEKLGLSNAYVADLDAIAGGEPDWNSYRELVGCGLKMWIDAGAGNVRRAKSLVDFSDRTAPRTSVVVGLESVLDRDELSALFDLIGAARMIFSLDLYDGRPWTTSPGWAGRFAQDIAQDALAIGIQKMIVLDVSRVGTGAGAVTQEWLPALKASRPDIEFIGGGGVRNETDLHQLAAAGYSAALVASALHGGALGATELRWFER